MTARRLGQVLWGLLRFLVLPLLIPASKRRPAPERARHFIEHMGGAWTKVGQALALRFDLLPAAYCNELLKLLNETQPVPYATVRRIVREELGADPEQLFASFDEKPLGSASIGQVHEAIGRDGKRLAVKVQRPRIAEAFRADFRVMHLMAGLLDLVRALGTTSSRSFVEEFARWTEEEIDYRLEARNAHRAFLLSQDTHTQLDVKVRFEISTSQVLVTEMMEGIPLLRIVRAVRDRDHAWLDDLAARGHSLERISRNIYWNMFNQVFRDGFFHADLHPANLFVLPADRIGYIDYGIVGRLSAEIQDSLRTYIRNLVDGDLDGAIDQLLKRMVPGLTTDVDEMRREMTIVLEDYRYGAAGEGQGAAPMQVSSAFVVKVMALARRHDLTMSHSLTLYFKALLTTDAVVYELAPGYDLFGDLKKFFVGELIEDFAERLDLSRALYELTAASHRSTLMLADLGRIQEVGRSLEVSLDTLRTMLVFYGVCGLAAGSAAVVLSRADAFAGVFDGLGFNPEWVTNGLYACAALLLLLMWRQGRRVSLVLTRREASRQEGFDRNVGPTR